MNELMNEAVVAMINDGKLSMHKINQLIYIKEFIDRISTNNYISDETAEKIYKQYGVFPNIITWGDYFQTELATNLQHLSEEEFDKAVDTVKFDMLASFTIFSEKDLSFFEWVDKTYTEIISYNNNDHYSEEEEEVLHLKILMDYYKDLGIKDEFTEAEKVWLDSFGEAEAI
jgi:hypothetical protein